MKSSNKFQFCCGDVVGTSSTSWDTNIHTYRADKNKFYIDNKLELTIDTHPITVESYIYLFTTNTAGEMGFNGGSLKIYTFKIWTNNTLVRDYIPCFRLSDGTVGLYDKVSDTFFENAGSGNFLKGEVC